MGALKWGLRLPVLNCPQLPTGVIILRRNSLYKLGPQKTRPFRFLLLRSVVLDSVLAFVAGRSPAKIWQSMRGTVRKLQKSKVRCRNPGHLNSLFLQIWCSKVHCCAPLQTIVHELQRVSLSPHWRAPHVDFPRRVLGRALLLEGGEGWSLSRRTLMLEMTTLSSKPNILRLHGKTTVLCSSGMPIRTLADQSFVRLIAESPQKLRDAEATIKGFSALWKDWGEEGNLVQ